MLKAYQVLVEPLVLRDQEGLREFKEQQVSLELKESKVIQVHKEHKDRKVLKDLLEHRVQEVLKGHKVCLEQVVPQVLKVTVVLREFKVAREPLDSQVLKDQ